MSSGKTKIFVVTGASATGKTTLIEYYKQRNVPELEIVDEAAREFYATHTIPTKDRTSLKTQLAIQDFFIHKFEQGMKTDKPIVLCDASALSCVAYASLNDKRVAEQLFNRIKKNFLPKISHFFLMDATDISYEFDPKDKIRQETTNQRQKVQTAFKQLLVETSSTHSLIQGTVEQRAKQIDKIMFD